MKEIIKLLMFLKNVDIIFLLYFVCHDQKCMLTKKIMGLFNRKRKKNIYKT